MVLFKKSSCFCWFIPKFAFRYIYMYMKLQTFSNDFLKIKRKKIQMNLTTKDKSSEIHIAESIIIKSSDWEKLLDI